MCALLSTFGGIIISGVYGTNFGILFWAFVIVIGLFYIFKSVVPVLAKDVEEILVLFNWAQKHTVAHRDPTTSDGEWSGTALQLIRAYRGEWSLGEKLDLLRQLKQTGRGSARNPDDNKHFSIWTKADKDLT